MCGWLSSPCTFEPSQTASSGLPVHTFSARNAMAAASRIGLILPEDGASCAVSAAMSIGVPGFEPETSATQRPRATRLRHTPSGRSLGRLQAALLAYAEYARTTEAAPSRAM